MTLSHDTFRARLKHGVTALAVAMSLYHILTAFFGTPISEVHLPTHLGFALVIIFWTYRKPADGPLGGLLLARDVLLTAMAVGGCAYLAMNSASLQQRMLYFDPLTTPQLLFGSMLVFCVLEAARRVVGWPLVILGATAIAYALWGNYLPSVLWHRGYSFESIIESTYLTQDGLWTTPLRVTATYVFLFVLFGAFLVASGAGTFFTDLARSLTGRFTGGAAKTAVVSSALMGSLSGSSAGNVVVTGSFTIPTMKRAGFPPRFSAGVEAVSSSGGQFMPPVMGSAAFIMAEFIGMPYIEIAQAAIIPALLYFISVIAMVHFEARRLELAPEATDIRAYQVLRQRGYLLLPVIVMLGVLSSGYTPTLAALYALGSLVLAQVVFERESRMMLFRNCLKAMNDAPRIIGQITIASAVGGIIVGVVTQTGLGLRMSSIVLGVSQGSLPLLLVLTMLCGVIMGMGMPTPAAYIILAVLLAPGLVEFGVPILAAHLFVMYCAGVSAITPPVALASYAAAAIADSDPWRTSLTALKLGLASFIVPYMFVFAPAILGLGSGLQMVLNTLAATVGVVALAAALIGWLWIRMNFYLRTLLFGAALMMIMPGTIADLAGGAMIVLIATYCFIACRRQERSGTIQTPAKQEL